MQPIRNARKIVLVVTILLANGAWEQGSAHDRIIGAVSPNGGAYLVKHFNLPRGAVVAGLEFVNNDRRTVFPRVAILRGPATRLSEATVLVEMKDVRPSADNQVRVLFSPIVLNDSQEMYVIIGLPSGAGTLRSGEGAGILATQLDEPGDSYFVMAEDGYLGRMDVEYAIDLLYRSAEKIGAGDEASPASPPRVAGARVQPNPFNPSVTIELSVPQTSRVELTIYDVAGRLARTLYRGDLPPGVHEHEWNGRDNQGNRLGSGIYLAKVRIGAVVMTRKLVLAQ